MKGAYIYVIIEELVKLSFFFTIGYFLFVNTWLVTGWSLFFIAGIVYFFYFSAMSFCKVCLSIQESIIIDMQRKAIVEQRISELSKQVSAMNPKNDF